jgi:hypothetical protein
VTGYPMSSASNRPVWLENILAGSE